MKNDTQIPAEANGLPNVSQNKFESKINKTNLILSVY